MEQLGPTEPENIDRVCFIHPTELLRQGLQSAEL